MINKISNRKNKGIVVVILVTMLLAIVAIGYQTVRGATPTAWVEAYSNGQRSGLRFSQLLEVKTSGFDKKAVLQYTYTNNMQVTSDGNSYRDTYINAYESNKLDDVGAYENVVEYIKTGETVTPIKAVPYYYKKANVDFKYFAMSGSSKTSKGNVIITIEDIGQKSSTKGMKATTTLSNLTTSNLSTDIKNGIGTIFVGEEECINNITTHAGVPAMKWQHQWHDHSDDLINFEKESVQLVTPTLAGATLGKEPEYMISTPVPGYMAVDMKKVIKSQRALSFNNKSNFYQDPIQSYALINYFLYFHELSKKDVRLEIYAFEKPIVNRRTNTIEVTNTMRGVTYRIGEERLYCSYDNQKLIFGQEEGTMGFLEPGTQYRLDLSKTVNGKNATMSMIVSTASEVTVNFDANGGTLYSDSTARVPADTNLSTFNATRPGYQFIGWNSERDGSGKNYSVDIVDKDPLTVYAQWKKNIVDVSIHLDNEVYPGGKVELYQNNKSLETLTSLGNGHYQTGQSNYELNGKCDIYIDGIDSGVDVTIVHNVGGNEIVYVDIYGFTASIKLNKNGANWNNQKVAIEKAGDSEKYIFKYDNVKENYTYHLFTNDPAPNNKYFIYINDVVARDIARDVEWNITNTLTTNQKTLSYYSSTIEVKKDGNSWQGANVGVYQGGKLRYTPTYNTTTKKYEINDIYDNGSPYDIYIKGDGIKENTNTTISSTNKNHLFNYYTVKFIMDANTHNTQIVKDGESAIKPQNPRRDGSTFDYWCSNEDGTGNKYFQNGATTTDPIHTPVTLYGTWQVATMKLGTVPRCDANGNISSSGLYYSFPNISLLGYPSESGSKPIKLAKFTTVDNSIITVKDTSTYTVQGNGTNMVTITFGDGVAASVAEQFLSTNVIVKPEVPRVLKIRVRVFGITA